MKVRDLRHCGYSWIYYRPAVVSDSWYVLFCISLNHFISVTCRTGTLWLRQT